MAFIPALPVVHTARPTATSRSTATMTHAPISRRAALRFAAFSLAAAATSALAAEEFSLKELKEDVEELKYDDEVLDVGPDSKEKNITRIKKKDATPKFRSKEAELLKEEDKKYDAMVEKELEDEARIKAQFSK